MGPGCDGDGAEFDGADESAVSAVMRAEKAIRAYCTTPVVVVVLHYEYVRTSTFVPCRISYWYIQPRTDI